MARLGTVGAIQDTQGAVYLEFLLAVIPLFVLFLAICQMTQITAARLVVSHAATAAARSAIVILDDPADDYQGAPRGSLSQASVRRSPLDSVLSILGAGGVASAARQNSDAVAGGSRPAQRGARMAPVRAAAEMPLLVLAPSLRVLVGAGGDLGHTLVSHTGARLAFSAWYTALAAAVTIHSSEASEALASEPVDAKATITARVAYLYYCGVPLVNKLVCRTLESITDDDGQPSASGPLQRLNQFARPQELKAWLTGSARFAVLTAHATLPNQGSSGTPVEAAQ